MTDNSSSTTNTAPNPVPSKTNRLKYAVLGFIIVAAIVTLIVYFSTKDDSPTQHSLVGIYSKDSPWNSDVNPHTLAVIYSKNSDVGSTNKITVITDDMYIRLIGIKDIIFDHEKQNKLLNNILNNTKLADLANIAITEPAKLHIGRIGNKHTEYISTDPYSNLKKLEIHKHGIKEYNLQNTIKWYRIKPSIYNNKIPDVFKGLTKQLDTNITQLKVLKNNTLSKNTVMRDPYYQLMGLYQKQKGTRLLSKGVIICKKGEFYYMKEIIMPFIRARYCCPDAKSDEMSMSMTGKFLHDIASALASIDEDNHNLVDITKTGVKDKYNIQAGDTLYTVTRHPYKLDVYNEKTTEKYVYHRLVDSGLYPTSNFMQL